MLLSLLENAGNRVFEIDPDSLERVAELEGRTIALEVRHLGKRFLLRPGRHGISLESGTRATADVTLIAAPSVFARIAAQGLDDIVPGSMRLKKRRFGGIIQWFFRTGKICRNQNRIRWRKPL